MKEKTTEASSKTHRTALITGSTSGIGLAIAHALAADGFDIVLNGRRPEADLEPLRQELADTHAVSVSYLSADISDPNQAERLVADAMSWRTWCSASPRRTICRGFAFRASLTVVGWSRDRVSNRDGRCEDAAPISPPVGL